MRYLESSSMAALSDAALFPPCPKYKQAPIWVWSRQTWLGEAYRASKKFAHEISSCMTFSKVSLPSVDELTRSISLLQACGFDSTMSETDEEAPIFVLSNGGRAGSTLLQRILITDPRVLLWGEPMGEMALVSRITEMMAHLEQPLKLLTWKNQVDANSNTLAQSWIATLYPSIAYFRAALRGIFDQWLGKSALDHGFVRWGFKEVRLGASEASLLHWLYPNAKFVITCRHPYDSYRSFVGNRWVYYYRYPEIRVDSAVAFAYHWNRLAMSWSDLPSDFPCFRMKYEDLVRGNVDFRKLESWLGIEIKEKLALSAPVGGSRQRGRITWYERRIIAREAKAGMRAMGYEA